MQHCFRYVYLAAALMTFFSLEGYAQRKVVGLSGIVYDSATRAPMPYVSVLNRATGSGTMSADNGTFTLGCAPGDTIVFTMLGYSPAKRVVDAHALSMVVFLSEATLTLKPVTVYGSFKPQGSDQWKTAVLVPGVFSNSAAGHNVQTFGPGVTFRGALSGLSKSEKEKRKVASIREKARKSEVYNEMIASEETKSFFRNTFSMSEDDYNAFVARFNAAHPEAAYLDNKEEIKNLMVIFKATTK